jgi:hypothetical protein
MIRWGLPFGIECQLYGTQNVALGAFSKLFGRICNVFCEIDEHDSLGSRIRSSFGSKRNNLVPARRPNPRDFHRPIV